MTPKHQHRDRMVEIGIQAIEHALRFLPQDNESWKVIVNRLQSIRDRNIDITKIEPETEYTQESCLRRASAGLAKLSVSEKWVSGDMLTSAVFVPCWDAGSFVGRGEEAQTEREWQDKTLYPLIEKLFE